MLLCQELLANDDEAGSHTNDLSQQSEGLSKVTLSDNSTDSVMQAPAKSNDEQNVPQAEQLSASHQFSPEISLPALR